MRIALALCLALVVSACSTPETYERDLDRAQEELSRAEEAAQDRLQEARQRAEEELRRARDRSDEALTKARERLAEARELARESGRDVRDSRDEWSEEIRREADGAMEELGLSETIGQVMEDVGLALQNESQVSTADREELRDLLPRRIAGMQRYDTNAEESQGWGVQVAHATAKYGDDERRLEVMIADLGTLRGLLSRGADWMDSSLRHVSDDGYRRSTRIEGYPALIEKDEHAGRRVEYRATVIVAERFVVRMEAKGKDLDDDIFDDVFDEIDLRDLARLARD